MSKAIALSALLLTSGVSAQPVTPNWNNSPSNWNNSQLNYDNSPLKWENSPSNWNNSPLNWGSNNGVYDNEGRRQGYVTESPTGVRNYYSDNGERRAYEPSKEQD